MHYQTFLGHICWISITFKHCTCMYLFMYLIQYNLFWCYIYIQQIRNVFIRARTKIFSFGERYGMFHSTRLSDLSPHETFIICILTKINRFS